MPDIRISEMMDFQMRLWEKHKDSWSPMEPAYGRNSLLWMMEEFGEVVAIIKKHGEEAIMNEPGLREAFVEEFADTMMYLMDAMLRFQITPDEFSKAYIKKANHNLGRDYETEEKYMKSE